jgi:diaminopimelate epimerase
MFAKGHGTQNDFVLLPDLDARLALTPAAVSALCDRRRGLGADGVLRVTTAQGALSAGVFDRVPEGVKPGDWYMDYRNADGSIAQMCGNGVRVFAHYLRASGLEQRDEFVVGSLAGPRPVVLHSADALTADVTVEMGKTNQSGTGSAVVGGRQFTGLAVDVGNPHLACVDATLTDDELACLDVAGAVRRRAVPRRRQRRGADRARQWGGDHASARTWSRRDPLVRNWNRRRRRGRPAAPGGGHRNPRGPGARRRGHRYDHRRHQLPAGTLRTRGQR